MSPILTAAALLIGVWQFNQGEQNKARLEASLMIQRDTLEYQRRRFEQRVEVYHDIARLAGAIAARDSPDQRLRELNNEFLAQYWGLALLVQDESVEAAMVRFHDEIADYERGDSDANRIKLRANELVLACRTSLDEARAEIRL
jgi:hypothetical protein